VAGAASQVQASSDVDVPTFREAVVGEVRRLNPLLRGLNPAADDITALIFEGLVRTNAYGEPEPALAEDWIVANNRIEYVFRLRQDVLWHDGTPFTARDVAFTMNLLRSPDFPGDPRVGEFWRTVETEILDDYTVRFRLTQPLGVFLDALRIGILPEHVLRGTTAAELVEHPFNLTPIGTGPYQREAIRTTDGSRVSVVDLRPAPVYAQRTGADYSIERVRFQVYPTFDEALAAFRNGDVDGLAATSRSQRRSLLGVTDAEIHTKLEPTLGALIFNWRRPEDDEALNPFREERVRTALTLGLNREAIVQRFLLNVAVPADNPLMPGSWAYAADIGVPGQNVDEARRLLEQANLPEANTTEDATEEAAGDALQFGILTPDDPALVNIAEAIANQWAQIGVQANVETLEPAAYRERLNSGDFDTALVELSLGNSADPDVYSFWHQGQFPEGDNVGAVDDRRISETLERARRDPFGLNRVQHYRDFQQAFVDRAIAIPLYYPLYTYAVRERVDGVQLGFVGEPSDRLRNIREWALTGDG
jgi:peptide/nickel transport system substrate-binding protein